MVYWCYGTASSILLLNPDSPVAPLSLHTRQYFRLPVDGYGATLWVLLLSTGLTVLLVRLALKGILHHGSLIDWLKYWRNIQWARMTCGGSLMLRCPKQTYVNIKIYMKSLTKLVSADVTTIYSSVYRLSKYDKVPCLRAQAGFEPTVRVRRSSHFAPCWANVHTLAWNWCSTNTSLTLNCCGKSHNLARLFFNLLGCITVHVACCVWSLVAHTASLVYFLWTEKLGNVQVPPWRVYGTLV